MFFQMISQYKVIANSAVQTYTQELWKGGIQHWSGFQTVMMLISFIIFPPAWLVFSLPLNNKYNKTPIVKFSCYLTSHLFFMFFQVRIHTPFLLLLLVYSVRSLYIRPSPLASRCIRSCLETRCGRTGTSGLSSSGCRGSCWDS